MIEVNFILTKLTVKLNINKNQGLPFHRRYFYAPGEKAKMIHALNILVGYAVKLSQPGGNFGICHAGSGKNFFLYMRGHSIGFSGEPLFRLFSTFQTGERATKCDESTGLGLTSLNELSQPTKEKFGWKAHQVWE